MVILVAAALALAVPANAQDAACLDAAKDPDTCMQLWEDIGLPIYNGDEPETDFEYICHEQFLVRHNNTTKTPDWVIERLTEELVSGDNNRPGTSFKPDPCLPSAVSAQNDDYRNSVYARGHQAPSADFKVNETWMRDTFVYSNAVPQEGTGFNSSIWSQLEDIVRSLATNRGELYVITGPIYQDVRGRDIIVPERQNPCGSEIRLPKLERKLACGGTRGPTPTLDCDAGVAIPAGLFKIVVDPRMGRVNAYLLPNIDHPSSAERRTSSENYLKTWRVSVLNLEDRAGYKFLPEYDRHRRRAQKESCPATMIR